MIDSANQILLQFARFYGTTKHAADTYGTRPYWVHLEEVEAQVKKWWDVGKATIALDRYYELRAAAWLHDVMEDHDVPKLDLIRYFGNYVADVVWRVSDEPGETRHLRHLQTYPKIRGLRDAVFLKLCDRIANVEGGVKNIIGGEKNAMYRQEHEGFSIALYTPGEFKPMWDHLEKVLYFA